MNDAGARTVLIVEDDRKTSALIALYLQRAGFNSIPAYSGGDALALAETHRPELTILDVLLPDLDGWELCRRLRATSSMPLLMLSSLGQAQDRIRGLRLGADDYVAKPFSPRELMARVDAILRRTPAAARQQRAYRHGRFVVDLERRQATVDGKAIVLTPSELGLLHAFLVAPGRIYSRDELLKHLHPSGGVVIDRVIDVHVGHLRQKIEVDPADPQYILTARGVGYYLADAAPVGGADLPVVP